MKEEIRRIMQLVKDDKLSPEDAAELIEAFEESSERSESVGGGSDEKEAEAQSESEEGHPREEEATEEPEEKGKDLLKGLIGSIEGFGKDIADSVNWKDVASQVRKNVGKGVEAAKKAADEARLGKGPLGTFFGTHESKTVDLPLDVPKGKILRIEGEAGDVKITGGADVGHVTATATFRAQNEEEAKAKAEEYTPMLEESDQFVLLRQPEGSDFTVDLEIYVKEGVPVEIRLQSGEIRVIDTKSSCRVVGRSGDVTLKNLDGTIDVSLYSGDVRIDDTSTSVMTVETKSGDINLNNTAGVMNLRTSSGDVRVQHGAGRTLSIEAASGDVKVDMAEPIQGAMNIRTVSGNAKVLVPDGSDCQVMLSTLRGSVSSTMELDDLNQESLTITGKLGEGNGSIDISAVNGDVHLGLVDSS